MSDQAVFKSLWDSAVVEYEKRVGRKIERDHTFQKFQRLDYLQSAIEEEKERFTTFRSEHRNLY